jgi:predicted adenine nucleotide alpha hydrolase (AANH) superfamily ATPase
VYPLSVIREENIDVGGLFFNPNIHPYDEYERRRDTVKEFSRLQDLNVDYIEDFRQQEWEAFKGAEAERCKMCYAIRMDKAAEYAAANGYDAFTTSLLVSPYQKHDLIRELGEKAAARHGIQFFYRDFRPGFRKGQQLAKELGLYRQKFCGCIISKTLQSG